MREVTRSRVIRPFWVALYSALPVVALRGALKLVSGRYCLTIAVVHGFRSLVGIIVKRCPAPFNVLLAISAGVSVTAAGTTGLRESLILVKSPARMLP